MAENLSTRGRTEVLEEVQQLQAPQGKGHPHCPSLPFYLRDLLRKEAQGLGGSFFRSRGMDLAGCLHRLIDLPNGDLKLPVLLKENGGKLFEDRILSRPHLPNHLEDVHGTALRCCYKLIHRSSRIR